MSRNLGWAAISLRQVEIPQLLRDMWLTFYYVLYTGKKDTLYLYGGQRFEVLDRDTNGIYLVRINNKVTVQLHQDGTYYTEDGTYCGVLREDLRRGVLR